MKVCPHCQGEFRLNFTVERRTKSKYLRAGCCNAPLREYPSPERLLRSAVGGSASALRTLTRTRSPNFTHEERQYLVRVASLDWFSGAVATNLLAIKVKTQASVEVVA
ncbi:MULTISPECIES: hypothetical protein [unclassified Tolypothrix]|uniref:hypothetical protein n=1 Tax=unclassified Tolypothrix TaxID=2649714 RepID=UPI0005EAC517|nr:MULTISPECIES: hypothetical protein [unclassified Tolypothrix]EKE96424.1 hypothetical protein FDUTEX481_09770 [Tolypothrix sp. PCC 7601]MBE9084142.1 hypothetical protein [Tolypothrix sp. LEGE 11397]UYD31065.1 hypothetical protein HGR01_39990 [Tolypothrix sp. PCC 7712]BAY96016.1 hypothetical protein NIES3275_80930 [Microchaete diplosiphon NIES-3275]